jgi:3'-phosphoadenosine 5'-phosphosulfate sulfotransferase (PAPS reductase)/FAD synthetase
MLKQKTPIKQMLEKDGYPFKSKKHSGLLATYQRNKTLDGMDGLLHYLSEHPDGKVYASMSRCPEILRYQFTEKFELKVSDKCCKRLKKEPLHEWQEKNNRPYAIVGLMKEEGGNRSAAKCIAFKANGKMNFQPLVSLSKDWEDWFIQHYNVEICDIYKEPYNFPRTGCKGCPFIVNLQEQLDTLEKYFPNERKQCEIIWKPVYDEYRRIGYRLRKDRTNEKDHQYTLLELYENKMIV